MSFIPDVSGPLTLLTTINVFHVVSTGQSTINVGDLLYFKQWDDTKTFLSSIFAEVMLTTDTGYYVYVYDEQRLVPGTRFIKVGNIDGAAFTMQLNSSDIANPYLDLYSGMSTFAGLYQNYYLEKSTDVVEEDLSEDSLMNQQNIRVRAGDLFGITDSDISLSGSHTVGLYSDSAFLKGIFYVYDATWDSMPIVSGTYNNFVMLSGSRKLEQIDMSGKFAYWDAKADNTITITATGNGITGGGDLTANRTIALDFTYLDSRYSSSSGSNYIALETPTGSINGSNVTFTLAHTPGSNTEMVVLNGLIQQRGVDYTITGATITLSIAPIPGDWLGVTYKY
jgi:hypothetical protein